MKKLITVAALAASLSGCASLPDAVSVERTAQTTKSKDIVWSNLIEFFASENISIKTIEKDSGIVYAERSISGANGLSEWATCGSAGLMAEPVRQALDLNVFVRDGGSTSEPRTSITVNTRFSETRKSAWDNTLSSVDCKSLGVLERQVQTAAIR